MSVTPDLDLSVLFGSAADGNAAVLTVGAVAAVAAARVVVVLLIGLLKALALVAAVGTVLYVGYQAVEGMDARPASVTVPADEIPTIGPLAPR